MTDSIERNSLPEDLQFAHDYCLFLQDVLVNLVVEGEAKHVFGHRFDIKNDVDGKQIVQKSGEEVEEQRSYDVNVRVLDATKNPVAGAEVTLHSTPRTATTSEDGIASFTDVEPGQHRVVIAYGDYTGEQSVNLSGDVKVFDLNVTVEEKDVALSKGAWTIIGILSAVIVVLTLVVFRYRRGNQPLST